MIFDDFGTNEKHESSKGIIYIYIKTLFFLENMQLNEIISFIKISKCFYFICFLHI